MAKLVFLKVLFSMVCRPVYLCENVHVSKHIKEDRGVMDPRGLEVEALRSLSN